MGNNASSNPIAPNTGIPLYFNIPIQEYVACLEIIQAAQNTWIQMVAQFAAENIAMGITQAGKTGLIANALQTVNNYGVTGSLWQAYSALNNVVITPEMSPFL